MKTLETRATVSFSGPRIVGVNAWTSGFGPLEPKITLSIASYGTIINPTLMRGCSNILGQPFEVCIRVGRHNPPHEEIQAGDATGRLLLRSLAHGLSVIAVSIVLNFRCFDDSIS